MARKWPKQITLQAGVNKGRYRMAVEAARVLVEEYAHPTAAAALHAMILDSPLYKKTLKRVHARDRRLADRARREEAKRD